jgi:hypothetical protein
MLSPSSVTAMEITHVDTDQLPNGQEGYGYGLDVIDGYKGQRVIAHTIEDLGYRSAFVMVPASGFAAIVFCNSETRNAIHAAEHAVDTFRGPLDVPAPVYTTAPSTWAKYQGNTSIPSCWASSRWTSTPPRSRATSRASGSIICRSFNLRETHSPRRSMARPER